MAGVSTYPLRPTTTMPSGYPSYDALGAAGAGAGSSISGSSYTGPNSPRTSYVQTPNLLPQENAFAMEQQNNAANIANDQMRLKAQLAAEAESRRLAAIKGFIPGGGAAPAGPGANIASDEQAARNAAFGRAKEQAGQTAQASLKALEDVMGARGLRGSTIEGNATADVLAGGTHELNDLIRSQTISDTNRAAQISDRNVAAGLTQRGQDMGYIQSLLGLIGSGGGIY